MVDARISVVIPVYKVEKYLDRCVESIVGQTYRNLEILLIDDGSPDSCPRMCEDWAKKDSRIKVIHKENAGLGMARNTGIEHATGKYICFVDSDDYLDTQLLEKACARAEQTGAELTIYGLSQIDEKGSVRNVYIPGGEQLLFSGEEVRTKLLPDLIHQGNGEARCRNLSLSVCVCLFRRELIERTNWRLLSEREIISEDSYAILELYRHVNSVAILSADGYRYCDNQSSLTRTFRHDRYEKIIAFYRKATDLRRKAGYNQTVQDRLKRLCLAFIVGALKQIAACDAPADVKMKEIKTVVQDPAMGELLDGLATNRYNIKIRMLFFAIRCRLYRMVYLLTYLQTAKKR